MRIKIFADHCVHTDLIQALGNAGFNVIRAFEVGLSTATDEEVFGYAKTHGFVLLTFDRDFGQFCLLDKLHSGVVIVSVEKMSRGGVIKVTLDFFREISPKDLRGGLFIIEPGRVRKQK